MTAVGDLRYGADGLIPVIAQDEATGAVLMLAYADRAAVERTLATGEAHFWSRSRQAPWHKGETSGNVLRVVAARADCDRDALLLTVRPAGPACHEGTRTCFEPSAAALELGWLAAVIAARRGGPVEASYSARLLSEGVERIGRKVGEEATETVIAAMAGRPAELASEAADLIYHVLLLLEASDVPLIDVAHELRRRHEARA